jgi:ABC-type phosphate transport system permease subunit
VIANEFAEATGEIPAALVELGLVLFLLTIVINAWRAADDRHHAKGSKP